VYKADGTPSAAVTMDGCFACHLHRADGDCNFTYFKNRQDRGNSRWLSAGRAAH
jgi:hypothetical protein